MLQLAVIGTVCTHLIQPNYALLCYAEPKRISLEMNVHRQPRTHYNAIEATLNCLSRTIDALRITFRSEFISLNHFHENRINVVLFASDRDNSATRAIEIY